MPIVSPRIGGGDTRKRGVLFSSGAPSRHQKARLSEERPHLGHNEASKSLRPVREPCHYTKAKSCGKADTYNNDFNGQAQFDRHVRGGGSKSSRSSSPAEWGRVVEAQSAFASAVDTAPSQQRGHVVSPGHPEMVSPAKGATSSLPAVPPVPLPPSARQVPRNHCELSSLAPAGVARSFEWNAEVTLGELQGMWLCSLSREVVTIAGFDVCLWQAIPRGCASKLGVEGGPKECWKLEVREDGGISRSCLQPQVAGPPCWTHIVEVQRDSERRHPGGEPAAGSLIVAWSNGEKFIRCSKRATLLPKGCTLGTAVSPDPSAALSREPITNSPHNDDVNMVAALAPSAALRREPLANGPHNDVKPPSSRNAPKVVAPPPPPRQKGAMLPPPPPPPRVARLASEGALAKRRRRRGRVASRSISVSSPKSSSSSSLHPEPMIEVRDLPVIINESSLYAIFNQACRNLPQYSRRRGPPIPRLRLTKSSRSCTAVFVMQGESLATTFVRVFDGMRIGSSAVRVAEYRESQ